MNTDVEAIYEAGMLRLLHPLSLPEHTHVHLSIAVMSDDERDAWHAQSELSVREVWDNDDDDVFNELLVTPSSERSQRG